MSRLGLMELGDVLLIVCRRISITRPLWVGEA